MPYLRYWEGNKHPGFYSRKYGIYLYSENWYVFVTALMKALPHKNFNEKYAIKINVSFSCTMYATIKCSHFLLAV